MKSPTSRIVTFCAQPLFVSLLLSGTVLSTFITTPAVAQASAQAVTVDIPAGALATSLNRLAMQTGLQIAFDASVTSGLNTPGVKGTMTASQALTALLQNTDIEYRFTGSRTVRLVRDTNTTNGQTPSDDGSMQLNTISVNGLTGVNFGELDPRISQITSEQLQQAQASTIPELVKTTPGVAMLGGVRMEGQSIAIRGFSRQTDVRILVDGAPKNFEKYDQGTIFVEPEMLKRVEIEKGATTVRYGNGGFGGTIKMETKDAADMLREGESWGAWGKTAYQTANKQFLESGTVYGRSNLGTEIEFDGIANLSWRKGDNMRVGGGEVYNYSNSKLTTFSGKVSAEAAGHKLKASVLYGESSNWGPLAAIRGQLEPSASQIKLYGYRGAIQRMLAWRELKDFTSVVEHTYDGESDLVNTRIMASYSSTDMHAERIPGVNGTASLGGTWNDAKYSDLHFEAENTSKFAFQGIDHSLNYGVQFNHHKRDVKMFAKEYEKSKDYNYGYFAPWIMPAGKQDTISFFIRDRMSLTDKLIVTPGLRYDYVRSEGVPNAAPIYNDPSAGHDYSAVSHHGFTPAISASYQITPETRLFVDWAYAMRAPNIDETYSVQSGRTKTSRSSRGLSVERNNTINVGVDTAFNDIFTDGDTLMVRGSFFNNEVKNPVGRRVGSKNNADLELKEASFYWNMPSYYSRGIELEAHYENDFMFADAGLTYMTGRRHGTLNNIHGPDSYINDIMPTTLVTTLGYKLTDYDINFGWTGTFVDKQNRTSYVENDLSYTRPKTPGYAVHDLFFNWRPTQGFMKDSELRIGLDNIFDKNYEPYLTDGITAMPGRNLKMSFSRKF
ncbi:TonB-dependent hemoglobin/transferrin/lactoferrin family receptor [Brucellaceae bacterium C25G]